MKTTTAAKAEREAWERDWRKLRLGLASPTLAPCRRSRGFTCRSSWRTLKKTILASFISTCFIVKLVCPIFALCGCDLLLNIYLLPHLYCLPFLSARVHEGSRGVLQTGWQYSVRWEWSLRILSWGCKWRDCPSSYFSNLKTVWDSLQVWQPTTGWGCLGSRLC